MNKVEQTKDNIKSINDIVNKVSDNVISSLMVQKVFELLGLQVNEHFKIKYAQPYNEKRATPNHEYWIDEKLHIHRDDDFKPYTNSKGKEIRPNLYLGDLLNGYAKIIKLKLNKEEK